MKPRSLPCSKELRAKHEREMKERGMPVGGANGAGSAAGFGGRQLVNKKGNTNSNANANQSTMPKSFPFRDEKGDLAALDRDA